MKKPSGSAGRSKRRASSIAIKRAYDRPSPQDGLRILIDRLWPRGLSKAKLKIDAWPREFTPSTDLRKWYGHEPERFSEFAAATGPNLPSMRRDSPHCARP
jgi:uncharacterized protein YeaO (DUF488 family)